MDNKLSASDHAACVSLPISYNVKQRGPTIWAKIFAASNLRSLRRSGGIYAHQLPPSTPNFAKTSENVRKRV